MGEANCISGMLEAPLITSPLGHYHDFHQHKENSFYSGRPGSSASAVESSPGFAIVEFDGDGVSVEHVPIEGRPMIDLPR